MIIIRILHLITQCFVRVILSQRPISYGDTTVDTCSIFSLLKNMPYIRTQSYKFVFLNNLSTIIQVALKSLRRFQNTFWLAENSNLFDVKNAFVRDNINKSVVSFEQGFIWLKFKISSSHYILLRRPINIPLAVFRSSVLGITLANRPTTECLHYRK